MKYLTINDRLDFILGSTIGILCISLPKIFHFVSTIELISLLFMTIWIFYDVLKIKKEMNRRHYNG